MNLKTKLLCLFFRSCIHPHFVFISDPVDYSSSTLSINLSVMWTFLHRNIDLKFDIDMI